jgi:hypothetical protein
VVAAGLLLLGGCVPPAEYVKVDEPFKVLGPEPARPFASAKACLFFTENSIRSMKLADDVSRTAQTFAGTLSNADPRRLTGDISEFLNSRFRDSARVQSVDEVAKHGCNLSIALDIRLQIGMVSFQTTSVELTATIADDRQNILDKLSAAESGIVAWPAFNVDSLFQSSWKGAFKQLGAALEAAQRVRAYVAGLPAYAEPVQAASAAAIDLAFWDSVKGSSNPADLQAYLQRFPNGSFAALARARIKEMGEVAPGRFAPVPLAEAGRVAFGEYHALVIGINNYRAIPKLQTAITDATVVAGLLEKAYGFKVRLLIDATRGQVLDAFDDFRRVLTEKDNLLIYYAGHGYLESESDRGFWLPVDADANRRANWLSNSDISDLVRATRATHVLVVADSCYAGTLTRSVSVQMTGLEDLARLAQKRSRTVLTSGGLEPVADSGGGQHSIFAKVFIDLLTANTGVIDMSQMFSAMRRQVILGAPQTPQYSDMRQTGHEGGDFIFVRKVR